jgi:hypothetical protein
MQEENNKLLFPEEFISFLWKEYPISSSFSSLFSISGFLISTSGLYLAPAAIICYSIAALNIVAPK